MQPVDLGTGITITFGTSGFAAEITSVSMDDISREVIDTSHLGTTPAGAGEIGSRTFLAGKLSNPGMLNIEGHHDADLTPPIEAAAEVITITFPLGTGETTASKWVFNGQMTSYGFSAPLEDKITFSASVKAVGPITITEAA